MAGLIERYRRWLPVTADTPVVSLEEGSTPLIPAPRLAERIGGDRRVFLKFEGANPTGSFKDRGMTVAVSKALEAGTCGVICASTGNTSASAAAYAGRAGLRCWVLLPAGKVAAGKLAQAVMHGAEVIALDIAPITAPGCSPHPANAMEKPLPQWSRPYLRLIRGVRPNSVSTTTNVLSNIPRSAKSSIRTENDWSNSPNCSI